MMTYRRLALAAAWMLSLIIAGMLGSTQAQRSGGAPQVLSGSDVGFRVEGTKGDVRVGTLVVRIDGRWVEVEFSAKIRPVK